MPYISQQAKEHIDNQIHALKVALLDFKDEDRDGVLNYIFTKLLKPFYHENYHDLNRAIGILESCKLEFYRRIVAPYEEKKIEENGDVE